ncbi:MAG: T9SS type A sorting domain-containing protein [Prolixibacteraceae bacterium]|jgi:hypothetical protein|nr:T9SS type A sorting domain-containing protein [Prolixibacteraceae bacterium]MDI9564731.1 T9SS type A sorting domain-containing protein [Bacteroidota bacterium]NLS99620.1 T9SS type A sorting domain-containing protein [Bacteroidales bacterium]HNU77042.1 T9SS type A sorting domain-containing protein [Prolixibacteraceae bacterium]HNZ69010.1 T9SS type A sorting domain-containing protein [Prolixibacteraceae bacterium]
MRRKLYCFLVFILLFSVQGFGQTWSANLVTGKLSVGLAKYLKMDIYNDTIYIAFADGGNGDKATVMKYTGSGWVHVGLPGFTEGEATALQFRVSGGIPWVAYSDGAHGDRVSVMRYNGSGWVYVGSPGFSKYMVSSVALAVEENTAWVAYSDAEFSDKATVVKESGGGWTTVGAPGFTPGMSQVYSLAVSGSTPWLAFRDYANNYRASVMKYDGSAWVFAGTPGFTPSTHDSGNRCLIVDGGTAWLAARGTDAKATVYRFSGSEWTATGQGALSKETGFGMVLGMDPTGILHVAFGDGKTGGKLSVMRYEEGSWVSMGDRFSSSNASGLSLAFKKDGSPVVAYNAIIVQQYMGTTFLPEVKENNQLTFYPNPGNGTVSVRWPSDFTPEGILEIWTVGGQLVRKQDISRDTCPVIVTEGLPAGIYMVRAMDRSRSAMGKVMVR